MLSIELKATGFKLKETSVEYSVDENGRLSPVKKKTVTKDVAPDLAALRFLIETSSVSKDYSEMSDEQLKTELSSLLKILGGNSYPPDDEEDNA